MITLLEKCPGLNTVEISKKIEKGLSTTERYLRALREGGVIEFRGAPKTGGYYKTRKKGQ